MMEDRELVERACGGDRAALEPLLERHANGVRAVVVARLRSLEEADDLTQETLYRGIRDLHTLRDASRFGPWLRGIARNLCRQRLEANARRSSSLADEPEAPGASVAATLEERDERSPLLAAVAELPEKLQEALLLFYVEGAGYEEIGRRLGITAAAVNRRLTRARNHLRGRLVPRPQAPQRSEMGREGEE
ncbi:MAG: RNA polymerase sigma factor [Planctomycetota bacterium]